MKTVAVILCFVILSSSGYYVPHSLTRLQNRQEQQSLIKLNTVSVSFSDDTTRRMSELVAQKVNLPYLPSPVVSFLLSQALERLSTELSQETMIRFKVLIDSANSPSTYDNLDINGINELADEIAKEISPKIDAPILNKDQELLILQQIMRIVLKELATSDKAKRKDVINTNLALSKDLLGSTASRGQLTKALANSITIPLLDEEQKLKVIGILVDSSAELIEAMLPADLINSLKGESPEGILRMKKFVVITLQGRIIIPGISKEQQLEIVEKLVDVIINHYVEGTDAEFLLLTVAEQKERLVEQERMLNEELVQSQERYEREQTNLKAQLTRVKRQLKEINRSSSLFRRIFRRKSE